MCINPNLYTAAIVLSTKRVEITAILWSEKLHKIDRLPYTGVK